MKWASPQQRRLVRLAAGGFHPVGTLVVRARAGVESAAVGEALARLVARNDVFALARRAGGAAVDLASTDGRIVITAPALAADVATLDRIARALDADLAGRAYGDDETITYGDYAAWQNDLLEAPPEGPEEVHWRAHAPELPAVGVSARRAPQGEVLESPLSPERWEALERAADRLGTDVEAMVVAAWIVALRATGDRSAAVLGYQVDGRGYPETQSLIGPCARLVPMRLEVARRGSFETVVRAVDAWRSDATEWHESFLWGFDRADGSIADAWPAHAFAHDVQPIDEGVILETLMRASVCDRADTTLVLAERAAHRRLRLHFDASRIVRGDAAQKLALLDAVLARAHAPATTVSVLLEATPRPPARPGPAAAHDAAPLAARRAEPFETVHERVFAWAAARPDRVAVTTSAGGTLTFGRLARDARRIAAAIQGAGAGVEDRVALLVPRRLEAVAAVLGVLAAGAAFVPLSPGEPPARMRKMLLASGARIALVAGEAPGVVEALGMRSIDVLATMEAAGAGRRRRARPEQLAYVMFTSGSTGTPKGCMIAHRNLAAYVGWAAARYWEEHLDGSLVHSALSFDLTLTSLLVPLFVGAPVHLVIDQDETAGLAREIAKRGGGLLLKLTPSHARMLHELDGAGPGGCVVVVGGEQLLPTDVEALRDLTRGGRLVNEYGPTETCVGCVTWPVSADVIRAGARIPVGVPIDGASAAVIGATMEDLTEGVEGELCVGGAGVGRGYVADPRLSAERYVPDPSAAQPGERRYRTGDLARWRPDATLEVLGRVDRQLKVRGHRIEAGEIEAALLQLDGVRRAIAALDARGESIVAHVEMETGPAGAERLMASLRDLLPAPMHPARIVVTGRFPLNAHGKVDVATLAATADTTGVPADDAPSTAIEVALCEIWCEVLRLPRVGIHDDFYRLGGHSLAAARVVARARTRLDLEVDLSALFEHPTVAALAAHCAALRPGGLPRIAPAPRDGDLPLTVAQERMWMHDELARDRAAYNLSVGFRWNGPLDAAALDAALVRVVSRHEALRTRLFNAGSAVRQRVGDAPRTLLRVIDLTALHEEAAEHVAARLRERCAGAPFVLAEPLKLRAILTRMPCGGHEVTIAGHHVALDGASFSILAEEMFAEYEAHVARRSAAISAPPLQPGDHAVWERALLESDAMKEQVALWEERLRGCPRTRLTGRAAARGDVARSTSARFQLQPDEVTALRQLAREGGVTVAVAVVTVFKVVLARIHDVYDVAVAMPVSVRDHAGLERSVGLFVNTLVLRTRLARSEPFAAALRRVRSSVADALDRRHVPHARLAERFGGAPEVATPGVVLVINEHAPALPTAPPGVTLEALPAPAAAPAFGAAIVVDVRAKDVEIAFELDASTAGAADAARIFELVRRCLTSARDDMDVPIDRLPIAPQDGPDAAEGEISRAAAPITVVARVCEIARTHPDRVALIHGAEHVCYGALVRRARRLAAHLVARGVTTDARVGLLMPRGPRAIASLFAVWMSGAAVIFLDWEVPEARLVRLLAEAGATHLLAPPERAASISGVTAVDPDAAGASAFVPRDRAGALAYVIHTSGSSGSPKAVEVEHRSLANLATAQAAVFAPEARARHLQFASPSFDAFVFEVVMALTSGGALVLGSAREVVPGADLGSFLRRSGVTHATLTPTVLATLRGPLPALETLISAGEPCSGALARRWAPVTRFYNAYGPTEACVWSTVERCLPSGDPPTIGRGIPGTSARVLDAHLGQALPDGVGEIFVGGAGVARGYAKRAALTARAFLPDPRGAPGARMYRTGDRARALVSGAIDFVGRADAEVKILGVRVDLREVEEILTAEETRGGVALDVEGPADARSLVAYVAGEEADVARLRARSLATLPRAMVPTRWVVVDVLPRTASGKVDRSALARVPRLELSRDDRRPIATAMERTVAAAWEEILGGVVLDAGADFFACSGDSLTGMQVASRLEQRTGRQVLLRDVFEHPILAGLAAHLEGLPVIAQAGPRPGMGATETRLSFAQERIWFFDRLAPGSSAYNVPLLARVRGAIDARAMAAAFVEIQRRHHVLRGRFVAERGHPAVSYDAPCAEMTYVDCARVGEAAALAIGARLAALPFDLHRDPPIRAALLTIGENESVLAVVLHHIVADGWSVSVFMRQLAALYAASLSGGPSPVAGDLQYADYVAWQRSAEVASGAADQLAYWRAQLAGAPWLALPTDGTRSGARLRGGAEVTRIVPASTRVAVEALAVRARATPFVVIAAALGFLSSRLSGQDDVCIGTPVVGRSRGELEEMLGLFLNTLVIRCRVDEEATFLEHLEAVRLTVLEAQSNQDVPFERVVDALRPPRDLDRSPLFRVQLNVHGATPPVVTGAGLVLEALHTAASPAKFDLNVHVEPAGDGLRVVVSYDEDLFSRARSEAFVAQLVHTIGELATHPEAPLKGRAIAPRAPVTPPAPLVSSLEAPDLVRLLAERLDAAPDAMAVRTVAATWSRAELRARVCAVAEALRALDVGGGLVAIRARRSGGLVAAMLGAWEVGSPFLIVEDDAPELHVSHLLRAARAVAEIRLDPDWLDGGGARDVGWFEARRFANASERSGAGPNDRGIAYVAHTSGTTGAPRLIAGARGPLSRFVAWYRETLGVGAEDRFAMLSGLSYDPLLRDVFTPLACGATLAIPDDATLRLPRKLLSWLDHERITVIHTTPSRLRALITAADLSAAAPLGALRIVLVGGEPLERGVVAGLERVAPSAACINVYGTTETPQVVAFHRVSSSDRGAILPIGRGAAGAELLVLDRGGRIAGVGELGEIVVRSRHLAAGYLREDGTCDPTFGGAAVRHEDGTRSYRTGDLGRVRPDGAIEIAGRRDNRINLHGERIELEAIETALRGIEEIEDAAVELARVDGATFLRAHVVSAAPIGMGHLSRALSGVIPRTWIPSELVTWPSLPSLPGGKVDRRALRASTSDGATRLERRPPSTEAERIIATIWSQALGLALGDVSATVTFFDLGGNSLQSVAAVDEMERRLGRRFRVSDMFVFTLEQIAASEEPPPPEEKRR